MQANNERPQATPNHQRPTPEFLCWCAHYDYDPCSAVARADFRRYLANRATLERLAAGVTA